jgi:hypothetical protein
MGMVLLVPVRFDDSQAGDSVTVAVWRDEGTGERRDVADHRLRWVLLAVLWMDLIFDVQISRTDMQATSYLNAC